MKTSWQILPVADKDNDFRWVWEETKNGNVVARSETSFQYYNECVEDAQKRGYSPPRVERLR
ncbi:MAG TPA: hypothetical protein VGP15_02390 [Burkholderiales bacterium]|jgi:hypothetical protein|nr:hypothetical protein [Burkholderiales bacterium]